MFNKYGQDKFSKIWEVGVSHNLIIVKSHWDHISFKTENERTPEYLTYTKFLAATLPKQQLSNGEYIMQVVCWFFCG